MPLIKSKTLQETTTKASTNENTRKNSCNEVFDDIYMLNPIRTKIDKIMAKKVRDLQRTKRGKNILGVNNDKK